MWVKCLLCLTGLLIICQGHVLTSDIDVKELLKTKDAVINSLEEYISQQDLNLLKLKNYLSQYRLENEHAMQNAELYYQNPISTFQLIAQLTTNWESVKELAERQMALNIMFPEESMTFPSKTDLEEVSLALIQLQDVYKLSTSSLSQGIINGMKYTRPMSSSDCFVLATEAKTGNQFYRSAEWLQEALRLNEEEEVKMTDRWNILNSLAYVTFAYGDHEKALEITEELLQLSPEHPDILQSKAFYLAELNNRRAKTINAPKYNDYYEMLCRGESELDTSVLTCRFVDHNIAYLRIGPLKVEEAFLSPRILIYHDVIYDSEIATIQRLSEPRLRTAKIESKRGNIPSKIRTSKTAWIYDNYHSDVVNLAHRSSFLTAGLSRATAEPFQVANYAFGGKYNPHHDYLIYDPNGHRIATVLYYLSDVEDGGSTVFPYLGVALKPKRGSAAVWHNLHDDGEDDVRTLHAGCPVLVGFKWICTKWFHYGGQEFIRPCQKK